MQAQTATIYRVDGKGKAWLSKGAAYRSAAIGMLNAKCDTMHEAGYFDRNGETCKYCSRRCDGIGRTSGRRTKHHDGFSPYTEDGYECEQDPTHSYRYRLVGRLARWLRWRDEKGGA